MRQMFGEYLIGRGIVRDGAIAQALELQRNAPKVLDARYRRVANCVLLIKALDETSMVNEFNTYLGKEDYVSTENYPPSKDTVTALSFEEQRQYECVVLEVNHSKRRILLGTISEMDNAITRVKMQLGNKYPGYQPEFKRLFEVPFMSYLTEIAKVLKIEYSPIELNIGVEEKLRTMFRDAIEARASDISLEPTETCTEIYFVIDTVRSIYKKFAFEKSEAEDAVQWIITQSGISHTLAVEKTIDCALPRVGDLGVHRARINKMTSHWGDLVNMRLLPNEVVNLDIDQLGYSKTNFAFIQYLSKPRKGIVLLTGSTNSGKNTSILSLLQEIKKHYSVKVVSLEHPVEYIVDGVNQVSSSTEADYRESARALVRQTPDVIYLSEMRDRETVDAGLNIANTGKLVLSTVHLDAAFQIFYRMSILYGSDISARILSEFVGVVNQALVPKACPHCRQVVSTNTLEEFYQFVFSSQNYTGNVFNNTGCEKCDFKGYKGVVPLAEYIYFDRKLKSDLRMTGTISEKEDILIRHMEESKSSILLDGLRNMHAGKVSLNTLVEKSILDVEFSRLGGK